MRQQIRIPREFFERSPVECARELVGCTLVWGRLAGMIVETEAYAAVGDPACHTFSRPSARRFIEHHQPGDAYVYFNYGMYWLFNLLVKGPESQGFVLVRAIEPWRGLTAMSRRRGGRLERDLCSGPGKLCMAFGIDGSHHGISLVGNGSKHLLHPDQPVELREDVRIGISQACHFPWRFLAADNPHVSVPPRKRRLCAPPSR